MVYIYNVWIKCCVYVYNYIYAYLYIYIYIYMYSKWYLSLLIQSNVYILTARSVAGPVVAMFFCCVFLT